MTVNNLYEQRKKFEQHKSNLKNVSRIKKLTVSLGVGAALVAGFAAPAFAMTTNATTNPNACFGQARSYYAIGGPSSVLGSNEGSILSTRQGSNSMNNLEFRAACMQ